jgi:hypothetical protein
MRLWLAGFVAATNYVVGGVPVVVLVDSVAGDVGPAAAKVAPIHQTVGIGALAPADWWAGVGLCAVAWNVCVGVEVVSQVDLAGGLGVILVAMV